jgi:hypothetical protein
MNKDESAEAVREAANRVIALEEELEASGTATTEGATLAFARAQLHKWVDSVTGVVSSPGVGRVTLIHENGRESKIASPDLPFLLSIPVTWKA